MVLDRTRVGGGIGAARFEPRTRHGRTRADRAGLWRAGDRHWNWYLSSTHPVPWIWGRVGGDALDIATLATGLQQDNPKKENVELALVAVAGITALDVVCGASLARHSVARHSSPKLRRRRPAIDYHRRTGFPKPPEQMRGAARDFEVPRDMRTPEPLRPFSTIPDPQ